MMLLLEACTFSFVSKFVVEARTPQSQIVNLGCLLSILPLFILLMVIETKCCSAQSELLRGISAGLSHTDQAAPICWSHWLRGRRGYSRTSFYLGIRLVVNSAYGSSESDCTLFRLKPMTYVNLGLLFSGRSLSTESRYIVLSTFTAFYIRDVTRWHLKRLCSSLAPKPLVQ